MIVLHTVKQGSATGRVFPGFRDPARNPGCRAGFRVQNSDFRISGLVPGLALGSGSRRKPGIFRNFLLDFETKNKKRLTDVEVGEAVKIRVANFKFQVLGRTGPDMFRVYFKFMG